MSFVNVFNLFFATGILGEYSFNKRAEKRVIFCKLLYGTHVRLNLPICKNCASVIHALLSFLASFLQFLRNRFDVVIDGKEKLNIIIFKVLLEVFEPLLHLLRLLVRDCLYLHLYFLWQRLENLLFDVVSSFL